MREILFRGKRVSDGEWVTGYYIRATHHWHKHGIHEDWIAEGASSNGGWFALHNKYAVDPRTVGQYTGLTDKNGKKVFEGDVLKIALTCSNGEYFYSPFEYPVKVVVTWDMCAWMWETISKDKRYIHFPDAWCHYECEVIGNIHDNPELLKQEDDT